MASLPPLNLKRNYHSVPSLQQFYSRGPFAFSSDGAFLACACACDCDDQIKLTESSAASICASLEGNLEAVTALTLSPNDKFLFFASHSRLIRVWDLSSPKCNQSWKGHDGPVMGMACHSFGVLLTTVGQIKGSVYGILMIDSEHISSEVIKGS